MKMDFADGGDMNWPEYFLRIGQILYQILLAFWPVIIALIVIGIIFYLVHFIITKVVNPGTPPPDWIVEKKRP